jgi:hypothetical protein
MVRLALPVLAEKAGQPPGFLPKLAGDLLDAILISIVLL